MSVLDLYNSINSCTKCNISTSCTKKTFGRMPMEVLANNGNKTYKIPTSSRPIMIIGEAPGEQEDASGWPFVGASGQLLNSSLATVDSFDNLNSNIFITNLVKCRPPENRNPNKDEITNCYPWLESQILLYKPKLVITLGKYSSSALINIDPLKMKLKDYLNTLTSRTVKSKDDSHVFDLAVNYHPAYFLHSKQYMEEEVYNNLLAEYQAFFKNLYSKYAQTALTVSPIATTEKIEPANPVLKPVQNLKNRKTKPVVDLVSSTTINYRQIIEESAPWNH